MGLFLKIIKYTIGVIGIKRLILCLNIKIRLLGLKSKAEQNNRHPEWQLFKSNFNRRKFIWLEILDYLGRIS